MKPPVSKLMKFAVTEWGENPFYMAGTEGTGKYKVLAITWRGRVGVRPFGVGSVRIRVEPHRKKRGAATMLKLLSVGWKQPGDDGQNRFSVEVRNDLDLKAVVGVALKALGVAKLQALYGTLKDLKKVAEAAGVKAKKSREATCQAMMKQT